VRILIVTQYFWPESFRINDVARGLHDRGHAVQVLTGMPNYPAGKLYDGYGWINPAREQFASIPVVRAPLVTRGKSKKWRLAFNYLTFAVSASIIGPLRCRDPVDAILVYEPSPLTVAVPGLVMGTFKRAPVLLWIQDLWPETVQGVGIAAHSKTARLARRLSDFVHGRCDHLLAQSRAYESNLRARGIDPARIEYLPNWAEDSFRPLDPATVPDPMADISGFRIVFAGNIGTAQSFETILEAAARLRDVKQIQWVIVGDGIMRESVQAKVLERGLQDTVRLLGWKPADTMPAYFAHADVLLVTLRSDPIFELTVPSKLQTYLACGRPVLAALNGEGAAIVRESGAGVVAPAQDAEALAEGALHLWRLSDDERRRMGLIGRAYFAAHFGREHLLDRLESSIQRLVAEGAHTHTRR
jgi:glycosyltransferase involved in cell wall biosynthesis